MNAIIKLIEKISKPIVKLVAIIVGALAAGFGVHKVAEAGSRKKAMRAAVRKNKKKKGGSHDS